MVYAIVEAEQGGVFRSADGGESWERLTMLNPRPMYYSKVVLDPTDANRVYLLGSNRGLFISDDGGRTFRDVYSGVHGEDHALWVDPGEPQPADRGRRRRRRDLVRSRPELALPDQPPDRPVLQHLGEQQRPFVVCGGLQDNGSWCTPTATNLSYGISFKEAFNVGGGDGMHATFLDDRTLIVTSQNGYAGRLDLDTMQRQIVGPIAPLERTGRAAPYRWYWTTPIAVSHFNPNTIFTGAQEVFRSEDRGASWKAISPDLTASVDRERLTMMGGRCRRMRSRATTGSSNFSALTAIAESPLDRHLLYTGADDGTIQRSRDGGQHWTNLTPNVRGTPADAEHQLASRRPGTQPAGYT